MCNIIHNTASPPKIARENVLNCQ